ncbi:MAG TPA: hypothetical protein VMT12_14020 [Syntrophales bacterium]|nr:hypothetical protein [Syntrophales bacterium]
MGEKLVRIFEIVTEQAGFKGRLELANKVGMTMAQAAEMKDTDELVKKLKAAASEIIDKGL